MRPFEFPADVEGYGDAVTTRFLYDRACEVPEDGLIVELGSYKGQGTIALGLSGRRIITIDHFTGETNVGLSAHFDHLAGTYRDDLLKNLIEWGIDGVVVVEGKTSEFPQVKTFEDSPLKYDYVDLLVIDGAHDYESVKADWECWSPIVSRDGTVVFDDVNFPEVRRFIDQHVMCGAWYCSHNLGGRMAAYRRIGHGQA